jgi:single-stranded DNA-binding protein
VNHVTLTGTVATQPRRRAGLDQPAVAFRLAVARDDDASDPLHVDVVCVQGLAGFAVGLEPDDHLGVAGRLDHHEWVADDGMRRARWVVIARELIVLRNANRAA